MEREIGDAAGMIWQYLNEHGQTTLGKLRQGTKLSDQLLLMGVGWLAREGKVSIVQQGRTVKVSLREGSRLVPGQIIAGDISDLQERAGPGMRGTGNGAPRGRRISHAQV